MLVSLSSYIAASCCTSLLGICHWYTVSHATLTVFFLKKSRFLFKKFFNHTTCFGLYCYRQVLKGTRKSGLKQHNGSTTVSNTTVLTLDDGHAGPEM
jgi:hypothetical protein